MDNARCQEASIARNVTLTGMFLNIGLSGGKFFAGITGNSQVLIADAVHSLTDLTTDIAVLIGIKYWATPADEDHPYGHGRIESIITAFIAVVLFLIGCGIAYNGFVTALESDRQQPEFIALIAAFISVTTKEWLYRWTVKKGNQIGSSSVIANAWHHRSDALSSIPALIAVGLAMAHPDLAFLDSVGAIIVSLFIIKVSWTILKPVLIELSDKGASLQHVEAINAIAVKVDGVKEVHSIRSRRVGPRYFVDLHVLVDGNMSVQDGHEIARSVKHHIINTGPSVVDVVVHLEPFQTSSKKNSK